MKKTTSLLPFLAVGLVLPLGLSAQSAESASSTPSVQATSPETRSTSSIRLLREAEVSQQTTSSGLIGSELRDASGTPIGEIHDIDLSGAFRSSGAGGGIGLIVQLENDDQLISIPAAALRRAGRQDLTLTTSLDDVRQQIGATAAGALSATADTAMAEGEQLVSSSEAAAPIDPANTIAAVAVAAPSGTDDNLQVSTAGVEIEKIQNALAESAETRDIADMIGVLSATDTVLLTGQVQDEEQREKVLTVVRSATERDVRDLMSVVSAAE